MYPFRSLPRSGTSGPREEPPIKTLIRTLLEPIRRNGRFDVGQALAKGRIVRRSVNGAEVAWLVTNSNDEIQSHQIAQGFYELAELDQLRRDIGERSSVLDVGANIGNHAIYFVLFMGCRKLIGIEPFANAYRHLLANLALNLPQALDVRLVGAALGRTAGTATIVPPSDDNIGLTRLDPAPGAIAVHRGSDVVGDQTIDLIKIDVEGMELDVLDGLTDILERDRPAIYLETSDRTRDRAVATLEALGYRLLRETRAYETQSNLTMVVQ